jgi:hypothetical protein
MSDPIPDVSSGEVQTRFMPGGELIEVATGISWRICRVDSDLAGHRLFISSEGHPDLEITPDDIGEGKAYKVTWTISSGVLPTVLFDPSQLVPVSSAEAQAMAERMVTNFLGPRTSKPDTRSDVEIFIDEIKKCASVNWEPIFWDDEALKKAIDDYGHSVACGWHTGENS